MIPELIDINIQQRTADIHVPILRQPKFMALLLAYISPTLKLQGDITNNILGSTLTGSGTGYSVWTVGVNYAIGDRVVSGRFVYECLQANNSSTVPVSDTTFWYRLSTDNIGLNERLNYNCQRMQLEYILNKRFNNVSSIYPPYDQPSGNIYISTNPSYPNILWCARGNGNASGSFTAPNSSNRFYYCGREADIYTSVHSTNYLINAPTTLLTSIGNGDSGQGGNIVKTEVLKYTAVGLTFDIAAYP